MTLKFVIQAHFRGRNLSSVHLDYRFQHPKYKNSFFGFTQFVDKGALEGVEKDHLSYCEQKLSSWDKYFKDPSKKRLGTRKSMGPIEWLDVNGFIKKRLSNSSYSQVMLKIAEGTYDIFEDRLYSIKIKFDKVKTKYTNFWKNATYIFRYFDKPFDLLSWRLANPDYSKNKLDYIKTVSGTFNLYETSTETNGHYLLKNLKTNKWYSIDRLPDDKFTLIKGRYQIGGNLTKLDYVDLTFDLFKTAKDVYYVGVLL